MKVSGVFVFAFLFFCNAALHAEEELFQAVRKGDYNGALSSVKRGGKINVRDSRGWTPLHVAAANGKTRIVALLIDKGAAVNARNNKGRTPLHLAASEGHAAVVTLLLQKGANLNIRDKEGWLAVHCAAYTGKAGIVELLVKNGADVNAKVNTAMGYQGWTPLHIANSRGNNAVGNVLLKNGANAQMRNAKGMTPMQMKSGSMQKSLQLKSKMR